MNSEIILITSQKVFDDSIRALDWHDAFIKESHFAAARWRQSKGVGYGEGQILRVLLAFPYEPSPDDLELIAFDVHSYSLSDFLESVPVAQIHRRGACITIEPCVRISCACFAYRWVRAHSREMGQVYSRERVFNDDGSLAAPFNLDWRAAMDLASKD